MTEKYIYKTNPYEHQRQALIKGAKLKNFAYFMEMGTGKTKVAIDNAAYLYQEKQIQLVKNYLILLGIKIIIYFI